MEVLELSELVDFKPGEHIFSEGDSGDCMYIIRSGEIEVIKQINGEPVVVARMGPDSVFGEMALVERRPRSATIRAVTDVSCHLIGGDVFWQRWAEVPAWMQDLYGLVIDRLRVTTRKFNPHSGRIPGLQIAELLSLIARESVAKGAPDVSLPMKQVVGRMTYMFDLPDAHVHMILDLLLESSLIHSEFDASREDKLITVDLPKLDAFVAFAKKFSSTKISERSTADSPADEFEFLNLLNRLYQGQATISASEEEIASRLNTRAGQSLATYQELIPALTGAGIWSVEADSGIKIDLAALRVRLADLQQDHEFPWLAKRILTLSQEVADSLTPERPSSSGATIAKGLTRQ